VDLLGGGSVQQIDLARASGQCAHTATAANAGLYRADRRFDGKGATFVLRTGDPDSAFFFAFVARVPGYEDLAECIGGDRAAAVEFNCILADIALGLESSALVVETCIMHAWGGIAGAHPGDMGAAVGAQCQVWAAYGADGDGGTGLAIDAQGQGKSCCGGIASNVEDVACGRLALKIN